jgi:hypothetical protein
MLLTSSIKKQEIPDFPCLFVRQGFAASGMTSLIRFVIIDSNKKIILNFSIRILEQIFMKLKNNKIREFVA